MAHICECTGPSADPTGQPVIAFITNTFQSRTALQMEILALQHQLAVCQRTAKRPRIRPAARILWSWLSRVWNGWREALVIVQPRTVIGWRRRKFREHWTKPMRSGKRGRPTVSKEVRDLIQQMSSSNPLWGAPCIVGEPRKIGIDVVKSTVEKSMVLRLRCGDVEMWRFTPSPTWRDFL